MMSDEKPRVPRHMMDTWGVQVGEERVEVSPDVTVAQIRGHLPTELRGEFDECVASTPLRYLGVMLTEWALPPEKLREYRRRQAETYYRSAMINVDSASVPAELDVNEVMRTRGDCLLGTSDVFLPRGAFSPVKSDEA